MHAYLDEAVVEEHSDEACPDARVLLHRLGDDAPHDGFGVGARVSVEANGRQAGAARCRRRRIGAAGVINSASSGACGRVTVAVAGSMAAASHDGAQTAQQCKRGRQSSETAGGHRYYTYCVFLACVVSFLYKNSSAVWGVRTVRLREL